MKRILVVGGSRGVGAAVAEHLQHRGHEIVTVSRTPSRIGEWLQADLASPEGITSVGHAFAGRQLDALLYLGGIWESGAFTAEYDFEKSSDAETRRVLAVNLVAPIELVRVLLPALRRSDNSRVVFMGSLSGLDNFGYPEVANAASKFGLRGAAQALRAALPDSGIGFTVINPGNLATDEVLSDLAAGRMEDALQPIPLTDVSTLIDWLLSLSRSTEVGDVNLLQKRHA